MIRYYFLLTMLAAGAAQAQTQPQPQLQVCDPQRIGARELADCLRTASDKSDKDLAAALEAALKSIDARPKILATRRARWRHFLIDSQTQWASWRDQECQDLAPLEAQTSAGDPRLACLIDHNQKRTTDLKARYP